MGALARLVPTIDLWKPEPTPADFGIDKEGASPGHPHEKPRIYYGGGTETSLPTRKRLHHTEPAAEHPAQRGTKSCEQLSIWIRG